MCNRLGHANSSFCLKAVDVSVQRKTWSNWHYFMGVFVMIG